MIFRVLATECLKLRRTLALGMVLLMPLMVVILQGLIGYFGADQLTRGNRGAWSQIVQNSIVMWTLLMLPLFVTLETSLLAGLEHANQNWKQLLALPPPRWTIYASKLLVTTALLWAAHVLLVAGTLGSGALLATIQPALKLDDMPWRPLIVPMAKISAAALFAVTIQHWVSLRWQSFPAALGFGMCAMVLGFVAANSAEWGPWVPWSMPLHTLRAAGVIGRAAASDPMVVALSGAAVVAVVGCWDFVRREI